eukprot:gene1131-1467_t
MKLEDEPDVTIVYWRAAVPGDQQGFMDLFNYLLRQRIVFLSGYVNDKAMDEEEEIRMYINSSGGQPYSVIGVVDAMQLFCKYYMKFTDMTADEVEYNTCRDTFMTPEQAQDAGLIDEVYRADDDFVTPPAVVRELEQLGLVDRLTGLRSGSRL